MGSLAPALTHAKLWLDAPLPGSALSMRVTRWPREAMRQAMEAPTMPAPITTTCWVFLLTVIGATAIIKIQPRNAQIGSQLIEVYVIEV